MNREERGRGEGIALNTEESKFPLSLFKDFLAAKVFVGRVGAAVECAEELAEDFECHEGKSVERRLARGSGMP